MILFSLLFQNATKKFFDTEILCTKRSLEASRTFFMCSLTWSAHTIYQGDGCSGSRTRRTRPVLEFFFAFSLFFSLLITKNYSFGIRNTHSRINYVVYPLFSFPPSSAFFLNHFLRTDKMDFLILIKFESLAVVTYFTRKSLCTAVSRGTDTFILLADV